MKKILLFSLALLIGVAVVAQKAQVKSSIPALKATVEQKVAVEPERSNATLPVSPAHSNYNGDNPNVVSVITLGTSANAYGNGYAGGQKTIVWADDTLKAITNIHRMGPGTTPPGLSGYLGIDLGINMGATAGDWTNNWQVYAATLNTGGTYFLDAARYPQGGIYSPPGNTSVNNAYFVYFAPNLSNTLSTWGGYSYGRVKLSDQSDSTKHLYWYVAPPYTYIPDGFTITQKGQVMVTDIDQNWESGSLVYNGNILLSVGTWNDATQDFDYSLNNLLPLPTTDNDRPTNDRIAASPDNQHVWIACLGNNGGTVQIGPALAYHPILFHSNDGGLTWSDPIAVQLDGPDGIANIVNGLLSDYMITQLYEPPYPAREEIPYTTAFDCDLVVDKWGNPHIGVVIGVAGNDPFTILTGDSTFCVYDIYSPDEGMTWCAQKLGTPKTFRGTFGDLTEDNRVNISISESGEKLVVSWLDTDIPGVTDNINPDVWARGFDLVNNMLTSDGAGNNQPDNVTFLSDITQQAWYATASHYLFTDGDNVILPVVTELCSNPNDMTLPVTFKYIPDFKYSPARFDIAAEGCGIPFPVAVDNTAKGNTVSVYPNPVTDYATVNINMAAAGKVTVNVTNMVGQTVMTFAKSLNSGSNTFTIDASNLNAGVYFVTVSQNDNKVTSKMVVR